MFSARPIEVGLAPSPRQQCPEGGDGKLASQGVEARGMTRAEWETWSTDEAVFSDLGQN